MSDETCDEPGCDGGGWIHYQHPLKPPGVIMRSAPCPRCNADGERPDPLSSTGEWTIFTPELDESDIDAAIKKGREDAEKVRRSGAFGPGAKISDKRYR